MRFDEKVLEYRPLPAMRFTAKRVALYAAALVGFITLLSAFTGQNILFPASYGFCKCAQSEISVFCRHNWI